LYVVSRSNFTINEISRGVTLKPVGLANLLSVKDTITEKLKKVTEEKESNIYYHSHVSNGIYVTVSSEFQHVDLRQHFLPENKNQPIPTHRGICLYIKEWFAFLECIEEVKQANQEFKKAQHCVCHDEPLSNLLVYNCYFCNSLNGNKLY